MIGITTQDGKLRIQATIDIPNAEAGQWSPSRIGRLAEMIRIAIQRQEIEDALSNRDEVGAELARETLKGADR